MTHRLPRSQPFECPLASLGHNTPSLETSPLHHPLSSSPLNSRVYQRSRNSSILDINEEEILYHPASCQNSDIVCQVPSDIYHLPCGSSNHIDKSNELERTRKHLKYKTPPRRNFSTMNTCIPYEIGPNNSYLIEISSSNENFSKVTNNRSIQNELQKIDSHRSEQYFLQKGLNSLYIQDERKNLSSLSKRVHNQSDKYFNEARVNICSYGVPDLQHENVTSHMLHSPSSRSETSGSENIFTEEQNYRKSCFTKSKGSHTQRGEIINNRFHRPDSQLLNESLANIGRFSPSLDQGYATLVSPSPSNHQIPARRRKMESHTSGIMFDKLPDDMVIQIFSWLDSYELCNVSKVCERFEALVWRTSLWRNILLRGEHINGDKALKTIFMRLCDQKRNALFHNIEKIMLSDGCKITNRGLQLVAKCPELTHLQLHFSINTSNQALYDVLAKCTNLQHLDLTGCVQITSLGVNRNSESQKPLIIQYLDLTDCSSINDCGLKTIVQNCPQLVYLYLRRCIQISDAGLKFVPSFCTSLRELSVSDCTSVTDFGLYELAKLGATLRYLSVAKCDQVSDAGLKVIARRCYKLRYLNTRGCEAVSDDSITVIARSCPRLRALDIGKCDVSDVGLRALAESCPNLKKISLKNCDMITDRGIHCIAYYCRGLQQLNIQDCQITIEGYRAVKKYCKRCIIEHTNPGFC